MYIVPQAVFGYYLVLLVYMVPFLTIACVAKMGTSVDFVTVEWAVFLLVCICIMKTVS